MSLDEIHAEKEIIDEAIEDHPFVAGEQHPFEGRNMLPILADGLGNHFVVDVSPQSIHFGWLSSFEHADECLTNIYSSFNKLIEAHHQALLSGAYSMSGEGYIEANFDKLAKVLTQHRN